MEIQPTRSIKESYKLFLDSNSDIKEYKEDLVPIIYWDDDCVEKTFTIDFWVIYNDGSEEWITCVPHKSLKPIKKYLYAKRISEMRGIEFRGLTEDELEAIIIT